MVTDRVAYIITILYYYWVTVKIQMVLFVHNNGVMCTRVMCVQ